MQYAIILYNEKSYFTDMVRKMTFYKTIVCLANSRKRGKRCVAGKEIVNNQLTHNWIRPVSKKETGQLSEIDIMLKDGKGPALLDVITIPILYQQTHDYQTENYFIDHCQRWIKQPALPAKLLPHLCDFVESLWINGYHSSHGKNDKIPLELVISSIDTSLLFIKPNSLAISVSTEYGVNKKVRANFTYNNQQYKFSVTDLAVELHYETQRDGEYPIADDVYLCISLGEPFEGYCYKLVSGVILLKMKEIYTIGHSNHSIEKFLELLQKYGITAVCDVRSHPYSKYNPQFDYETLKQTLKKHDIAYVFLGKELGARSNDSTCYDSNGKVQYARLVQTSLFDEGIKRLNKGMGSHRIVLMCAEKDPLMCHRTILICRHLRADDLEIKHILETGYIETQQEAEQRLMEMLKISKQDLFASPEQLIERAYETQGEKIAYTTENNNIDK
jgi:hypothetical protein